MLEGAKIADESLRCGIRLDGPIATAVDLFAAFPA